MSRRLFATAWIALAATSAVTMNCAFGDSAPAPTGNQLAAQIQSMDPNAVRDAGLQTATLVSQLPAQMAAQGIPVTAQDEANANKAAAVLAAKANEPDFKDKIADAMKKVDNALIRAGIDSAKGVGYAGTSIFAVGITPFMFGADFFSALIFGRGPFTDGSKDNWDELFAATGGLGAFYYTYLGLQLTSVIIPGTVLAASMGIVVANVIFCAKKEHEDKPNAELVNYCKTNRKILRDIDMNVAKGGDFLGKKAHEGILAAVHFIEKPFKKDEANPAPQQPATPSVNPAADPAPAPILAPSTPN